VAVFRWKELLEQVSLVHYMLLNSLSLSHLPIAEIGIQTRHGTEPDRAMKGKHSTGCNQQRLQATPGWHGIAESVNDGCLKIWFAHARGQAVLLQSSKGKNRACTSRPEVLEMLHFVVPH